VRVLMVSAHGADAWRGGVERGLHLVAGELMARGVEVSVLRAGAGGDGASGARRTRDNTDGDE